MIHTQSDLNDFVKQNGLTVGGSLDLSGTQITAPSLCLVMRRSERMPLGEGNECSAYYNHGGGARGCTNGFPVCALCSGMVTLLCGCPNTQIPACQREDLRAPWIDESGKPRQRTPEPLQAEEE